MSRGSVGQFLTAAQESGLFSGEQSQEITSLCAGDSALTVEQVASRMVEKNILTVFQAEQLLAGRGKECLIAGRYRVLEKLGEGGMGAVYKAQDTNLDRVVAIKVLPAGRLNDADAIARFQREAKALARLSHPNITQAYDSGSDEGRHFLVMEFVEGIGLDKVLRQHGALPPGVAADFIHQAAIGLEHSHEKGLVHRDLKPANLLVAGVLPQRAGGAKGGGSKSGGSKASPPVVKILDLGLARFLQDQIGERQLTQEGTGMGTPDYMAPEQFRDALNADVRSDIYGLGCTLYHLIAGQVPFPGSSFSEKAHAHAKKEPIPLEEYCPEVPAGLAIAVAKMMAKHPDARFQTAGEAASALAPFVAGSSQSVIRLKASGEWKALGALSATKPKAERRNLFVMAGGGAAIVVLLVVSALLAAPYFFSPPQRMGTVRVEQPEEKSSGEAGKSGGEKPAEKKSGAPKSPESKQPSEPPAPKVITIENGLTVAKDGTGQYQTISEALEKVSPNQTIRVLDNAVYQETLTIGRPSSQTGITLESVKGATLQFPANMDGIGLKILSVPQVTVRGFQMTNAAPLRFLIVAYGRSSGLHLQSLRMTTDNPSTCHVSLEQVLPTAERTVVEDCTLRGGSGGVRLSGFLAYDTAGPCGNVLVRNNTILEAAQGILLVGSLKQVCVVGNRVGFSANVAVQLENLLPGAEDILIANNTLAESATGFRYWDNGKTPPERKGIRLAANLVLESERADMMYLDSGGDPFNPRGPGDGASLHDAWQWEKNWRETKIPTGSGIFVQSWIPLAPADRREEEIPLLSREVKSADFLKPAKDSPLATGGLGGDFPAWVGAVPPEDAAAWDWEKTWTAFEIESKKPKVVTIKNGLTVAQDGTGQFKTIGEALDKVSEGQTIRVLDNAVYQELVKINRATSQAGITLESPLGATLKFPSPDFGIRIVNVPRVTVRGFTCTNDGELKCFVLASGRCQGLRLSSLKMNATSQAIYSIALEGIAPGPDPMFVENCTIYGGSIGIRLSGFLTYNQPNTSGAILIRDNTILNAMQGLSLVGSLKNVCVAGNRVGLSEMVGLQLENLLPGTENILIANNSFVECTAAFRYWDNGNLQIARKNIRITNNLMLRCAVADMIFCDSGGDLAMQRGPGDGKALHTAWRWGSNWRETPIVTGEDLQSKSWIPVAPSDQRLDEIKDLNRNPKAADFLQPAKDSPLATGGVGGDLPGFVGAVPPVGAATWDWDKTWKALEAASSAE